MALLYFKMIKFDECERRPWTSLTTTLHRAQCYLPNPTQMWSLIALEVMMCFIVLLYYSRTCPKVQMESSDTGVRPAKRQKLDGINVILDTSNEELTKPASKMGPSPFNRL